MSLLRPFTLNNCSKTVVEECVPHNMSNCFGATLDYSTTSLDLVSDANTIEKAKEKLLLWSGLRSVPKCWEFIQPLLCALYLPKCENGTVHRPDRSLCETMKSPCKIVEIEHGWPDFMLCDNDDVYADGCPTAIDNKFNKSECEKPLMATSNPTSWYEGVEGCGLQCMNPLFNQQEHDDMHSFIAVWASVTAVCTLFAMLSFFIDWKNSSKYPARIIFYINVCFFLCTFGWLAQFFQGSRDEIICRKDGTVRLGEPVGHDESPSCVIIFVFVYFFVMAGVAWFVVLSYSWKVMFQALGKSQDPLKDKTLHFHLFAWSVAFVLLIASLAVSQIDGDSMSGICFIGYKNHWYRMAFLLVPIGLMLFIGGFYLLGGLLCLLSLKHGHDGLLSDSAISKITWTMIRIGLFALSAFIFVFVTFASHVYQIVNQPLWDRSFRDYIRCDANITILEKLHPDIEDPATAGSKCFIEHRPNTAVLKVHLFAMFGTGIVMSTWVWTKASFVNWRRAWFKLIGRSDNEMKRIRRKSKIIAKAFANRHHLGFGKKRSPGGTDNEGMDPGELEFSAHTLSHQDPVGMDFDLNSVSQELSSNWMRNVPKMVRRRGAIMPQPVSSCAPTPSPTPLDCQNADIVWDTDTRKGGKDEGNKRAELQCRPQTGQSSAVEHWQMKKVKKPSDKLPPIKTRRSAVPNALPQSEKMPIMKRRVATPIDTSQRRQCELLPGLIGCEEPSGTWNYPQAPYLRDGMSMPFVMEPDDVVVRYPISPLQVDSIASSGSRPSSHHYNLRPSRVLNQPEYSTATPTRSSRHIATGMTRYVH